MPIAPPPTVPADLGGDIVAKERHPAAIRWMHWLNFPLLGIMMWSGFRIYWANDVYAFGILDWELFQFFPDGINESLGLERRLARGLAFHFTFGWLFVLNGLVYVVFLAVSGEYRHIVPSRRVLSDSVGVVLHDLRLRDTEPPKGRYNAAQQIAYSLVILLGILIVATGFAIYKPNQLNSLTRLFGGYESARRIHFFTTISFLGFFVVHILQVARAGWSNFVPMLTGFELQRTERAASEALASETTTDEPSTEETSA